jgi:hypothetical protein
MRWISSGFVTVCWYISLVSFVGLSDFVLADIAIKATHANELHIQPNTCVSLHRDQACFVNLNMSWHTATSNNYCLYSSAQIAPLKCWFASNQGTLTQQFGTDKMLRFYLKLKKSDIVVAESELKVSWVYKKQQKSRLTWRLF